jgi:hypothetical protein
MQNFLYVKHREKCWWILTLVYFASILTIPLLQAKLFSIVAAIIGTVLYVLYMFGMVRYEMKKK